MARRYCYDEVVPFTAMVAAECTNVGLNVLFKAASLKGLSYYVFIAYSYAIASIVLIPLSFFFRRKGLPPFQWSLLYKIFPLGLIGFLANICGFKGIEYSSPVLSSSICNLIPAFTFILAVMFRMEKLHFRSTSTQAKILGTIILITGASVAVLYKGPKFISTSSTWSSLPHQFHYPLGASQVEWVIGGILFTAQCLMISTLYIGQTHLMKLYPDELVIVCLYNLCVATISTPFCLIAEPNLNAWRIRPNIELVATIYSGFFASNFVTVIQTWGLSLKGPIYISIFRPLSIVIAAVMGVIFLGEPLHLGSFIGAMVLSVGYYAVIWGIAKEEDSIISEDCGFDSRRASSSSGKTPLLQSFIVEDN